MAAKQVIILTTTQRRTEGIISVQVAMWFPVPVGDEYPQANYNSAFVGVDAAEIDALRTGKVIERTWMFDVPATFTAIQVRSFLEAAYTSFKAQFDAGAKPGQFYGSFWDGATWVAG